MPTLTISKRYTDIPFAHRQPNHDGHCKLIHGHNWSFEITFVAQRLDACGFVVDFGKLQWVRQWLEGRFDHALVLNENDPALDHLFEVLGPEELARITIVPDCSCEGLAKYLYGKLNDGCASDDALRARGVRVLRVTVYEDSKNSACYEE